MFDPKTYCVVVVGAQWGDEGKGKLVDVLAEQADMVVRYQGGANAGHTVVVGDSQFVLRLIPSGTLNPRAVCVLGNGVVVDPVALFEELDGLAARLLPLARDTGAAIHRALAGGKRVLLEGAQGALLDIDHGTYPFVTSSNTTAGGAATGAGIGPTLIDGVLGVVKAYTTRVGNGPLPTLAEPAIEERLRRVGGEFGAVTGRPRRCGWFDTTVARYAARVNGLTALAVTKLDVLDG